MPRRAILKFRNPDSTQDLNDRFKDLFNKGFFSGGAITAVPGVLKIDLGPFATAGSDGMFVREDSETTRLDVVANFKNYIVIRQEYVSNADPVVSIESLTEPEFLSDGPSGQTGADNPTLIVFGVVNVPAAATAATQQMVETFESDIVDNLGRLEFRGLLADELDLPGSGTNQNRAGDFYIITDGAGDSPKILAWNGIDWINITNSQDVLDLLNLHRQNALPDEIHLTSLQSEAVFGSSGVPSTSNLFVTESDNRLLTVDQANANAGNSLPLEDSLPSDSNRWVSSSKVFAVPTEVVIDIGTPSASQTLPTSSIELPASSGPYFVGNPSDAEAIVGTVQQWFNIYSADSFGDEEFINGDFNAVQVTAVKSGPPNTSGTTEIDPSVSGTTDDLGFFTNPTLSLYLTLSAPVDAPVRVSYGKRGSLGTLLPHLLMNRGPKGGQIDTRIVRLLFGTPNAQFVDTIFEVSVAEGAVVAFNAITMTFVNADPDAGLTPVGIRGNFNNLIMEGLYTANSNLFSVDFLYADKANPGSLTNTPNEWFIGRAISSTQLLVNMNHIPLLESGELIPPVTFPAGLFDPTVQSGTPVCWFTANLRFEAADSDDPDRLPLGIRGNSNNVISNSKYIALTGSPFVSGTRYYAGAAPFQGTLVTTENDWFIGIGIDSITLLVNANSVAIPAKWEEEHTSSSGFHKFKFGNESTRNTIAAPSSGMIFIRTDTIPPRIEFFNGTVWGLATSDRIDIPSGSKMLFIQDVVPTGWTLDVAVNDAVVRVVDSAAIGGDTAGSWTITGFNADSHILTITEMPSHQHDLLGSGGGDGNAGYNSKGPTTGNNDLNSLGRPTELEGGGAGHTHTVSNDGNWRPSYVNAIICIRD